MLRTHHSERASVLTGEEKKNQTVKFLCKWTGILYGTVSMSIFYAIMLPFTMPYKYCVCKLKSSSQPALSKSVGAIFQTVCSLCVFTSYLDNYHNISNGLLLLYQLNWSLINFIWCCYSDYSASLKWWPFKIANLSLNIFCMFYQSTTIPLPAHTLVLWDIIVLKLG